MIRIDVFSDEEGVLNYVGAFLVPHAVKPESYLLSRCHDSTDKLAPGELRAFIAKWQEHAQYLKLPVVLSLELSDLFAA